MSHYRVDVTYPSDLWPEYDSKLEKVAGSTASGAGMGYFGRDMSWSFSKKKSAVTVFSKLTTVTGLEVQIVKEVD